MKAKKLVMGLIILCFLISITCVSASENINDTIAEKDEISLDGTDLNSAVLKDSNERQKTIDELANEIPYWETFEDVKRAVDDWMDYYNNERYQWSLAKLSPNEYYEYITTGAYPDTMIHETIGSK